MLKIMRLLNKYLLLSNQTERIATEKLFKSKYVYEFKEI